LPTGFSADPKVRAFLKTRLESLENDSGINMATAEALSFATLLHEGTSVRLSGQDCIRGTFTQRHLAIHDAQDGRIIVPLAGLAKGVTRFDAINSPLIEYGVLAFEYGMSLADPDRLVMWEAQFGDFLNGAQVAVDQYIVTAESKWRMPSSLVIALPHGLEGQGPDHSSARIERILQSCAHGNITVALPSTPANLFHLLRQQQRGERRAPLFLIAPKSLLREKECRSRLADFEAGTRFLTLISTPSPGRCGRIVLCSGKIFYPLNERRARERLETVSLARLEQLYPFPEDEVRALLDANPDADLVWCQEEPRNQGAYSFVVERFAESGLGRRLRYVGRPPMAAAAGGSIDRHECEQEEIVSSALHRAN
jgi:2-oxoglutarate dehydrogenase E1 component